MTEHSEQGQLAPQAMHNRKVTLLEHPQRRTEQTKSALEHLAHQAKACSRNSNLKALTKNYSWDKVTMIRTASKNLEEVGVFYKEPTNVVAT